MKPALLLFLSFQLSAQIPNWVIDSLIFETKLGRLCDSLSQAQQTEINALQSLISAQASQLSNQKELIATQAHKIALAGRQLEVQVALGGVEKGLLKTRLKSVKRWLVISGAGNVILLVVLLL